MVSAVRGTVVSAMRHAVVPAVRRAVASAVIFAVTVCLLPGCVSRPQKTQKLRDLEFTVLDKDAVPEEIPYFWKTRDVW